VPADSSIGESEAHKAGFRALTKERWDKLQAEYAEYRESLLLRIAADTTTTIISNPAHNKIKSTHTGPERTLAPAPAVQPPSYPAGCVLFARHVPPDTNKTALRTRFSDLLADPSVLDYVDYTKGLDSVSVPLFLCLIIDLMLAVLFAPDKSRARVGAAGSCAV
jgi:hypothetical protein